ncbi:winged helix-turn-helix domain-containing protein [Octadecabacter sp. SW4]|uniref:winged helix-turn-helix domain-containing protein n=1 Tax=Octadecabacter sp. SW4 TaxID=2602067 RepID=UPI00155AC3BF|nr:winged helix-turn-helix domain-containing protein [Octadecabacter sp. SW4]
MADLTWDKAIQKVLTAASGAMHYTQIAEDIEASGYRQVLGATPANSVNMIINKSINEKGDKSKYVRLGKGMYALRIELQKKSQEKPSAEETEEGEKSTGIIQCLGMYWKSENVSWKNNPKLFGQATPKSDTIDFSEQIGIYLLHDRDKVVYVGRVDEPRLGQRLFEHTKDRLNARWDRFSWFGLRPIDESGNLGKSQDKIDFVSSISALEAILIESLEPPQNRRRGDQLNAVEYIQTPKPLISEEKAKAIDLILKSL